MPAPTIFTDPSYAAINRIILSTSTLASPNFSGGGFCPVQPDGFGLPYQVDECASTGLSPEMQLTSI